MVTDEIALAKLMELIEYTKANAYSCQETLDLLDEYAELAVANQDVAIIMPLVKNHINNCPDCTDRYEALVQILQNP